MEKNLDSSIYSFEKGWWWDCLSTLNEEVKQLAYMKRMGLNIYDHGPGPVCDLQGKSVIDIGGGPVSFLLKTVHRGECYVIDPIKYPDWTIKRYEHGDISFLHAPGEELLNQPEIKNKIFDEVWIYNVLQHVINPQTIIESAKQITKCIRLFEWIDMPVHTGHPHELKESLLSSWLGGKGKVEIFNETGLSGKAFYGEFYYEK